MGPGRAPGGHLARADRVLGRLGCRTVDDPARARGHVGVGGGLEILHGLRAVLPRLSVRGHRHGEAGRRARRVRRPRRPRQVRGSPQIATKRNTTMASHLPPLPPPPLPPPPPPPPHHTGNTYVSQQSAQEIPVSPETEEAVQDALLRAAGILEKARCLEAEQEASILMASSLLGHPPGNSESDVDVSNLPGGVRDAWEVLADASSLMGSSTSYFFLGKFF